jgi:hypothetical protein
MSRQPEKPKRREHIKAKNLDSRFDGGKDITSHLDLSRKKRPNQKQGSKNKFLNHRFFHMITRTKRVAAASVAAIPAEAIPFLGVGVLVAGTAYELYEACESMKDLDELYAGLGMADEVPGDIVREVCEAGQFL